MREFKRKSKDKYLIWSIGAIDNKTYETTWGQEGGKLQTTRDTPGSKGKLESKAFVNDEDNMNFHISREIRYKLEEGYIEYRDGKPLQEEISTINFNELLPTCLSSWKPNSSIDNKDLKKLYDTGNALMTIKRDGFAYIAAHHVHGWEIYSRRLELQSEKFPHHIAELNSIKEFDIGTILVGELQCVYNGREKFRDVQRFSGSDLDIARKLVTDGEIAEPTYMIFDMLFLNGKDLKDTIYEDRAKMWREPIEKVATKLITLVEYVDVTPETWEKYAKDEGIEGFVVIDKKAKFGDKLFNFNGKPSRPKGSYKLKLWYTGDTVIFAASRGAGKRIGGIGAVHLKQIDPVSGKYFYVSKCGTGFSEEMLKSLEKLFQENNLPIIEKDKDAEKMDLQNDQGIVAEVKYPERMPGTNSLRFPVFVRLHGDKLPKECIAEHLVLSED